MPLEPQGWEAPPLQNGEAGWRMWLGHGRPSVLVLFVPERHVVLKTSASSFSSSLWPVLSCVFTLQSAARLILHGWYLMAAQECWLERFSGLWLAAGQWPT